MSYKLLICVTRESFEEHLKMQSFLPRLKPDIAMIRNETDNTFVLYEPVLKSSEALRTYDFKVTHEGFYDKLPDIISEFSEISIFKSRENGEEEPFFEHILQSKWDSDESAQRIESIIRKLDSIKEHRKFGI